MNTKIINCLYWNKYPYKVFIPHIKPFYSTHYHSLEYYEHVDALTEKIKLFDFRDEMHLVRTANGFSYFFIDKTDFDLFIELNSAFIDTVFVPPKNIIKDNALNAKTIYRETLFEGMFEWRIEFNASKHYPDFTDVLDPWVECFFELTDDNELATRCCYCYYGDRRVLFLVSFDDAFATKIAMGEYITGIQRAILIETETL